MGTLTESIASESLRAVLLLLLARLFAVPPTHPGRHLARLSEYAGPSRAVGGGGMGPGFASAMTGPLSPICNYDLHLSLRTQLIFTANDTTSDMSNMCLEWW